MNFLAISISTNKRNISHKHAHERKMKNKWIFFITLPSVFGPSSIVMEAQIQMAFLFISIGQNGNTMRKRLTRFYVMQSFEVSISIYIILFLHTFRIQREKKAHQSIWFAKCLNVCSFASTSGCHCSNKMKLQTISR